MTSSPPDSHNKAQQLLTADQHRRLAAMLRKATTPGHEEQALHHERLADSIDRANEQADKHG
jgi:hypothetical protein